MRLFTSSTCLYWPKAEEVVSKVAKEERVLALRLSVNTDEGMREALKYGISRVHALVVSEQYFILAVLDEVELGRLIEELEREVM